ncbi:MAG: phosphate ABC transporter ATP-binding protein PstB [Ureaplasma sp.]|nr:phosphate ABC transporter ATP-binding protein PstB [Ureaplasma sp.]
MLSNDIKKESVVIESEQDIVDLHSFENQVLYGKELYRKINSLSFWKKIFYKAKLSKEQKISLKEYKNNLKIAINTEKEDFNENNIFEVSDFNLWYLNGQKQSLFDININLKKNKVTAFIGPSGCGKSTFLRSLNRMNDLTDGVILEGSIYFNKWNIYSKKLDPLELRTKVGLVFQKPTPFSMSIYDNIAFALRQHGVHEKHILDQIVEESLRNSALWDEVKDDLDKSGLDLSGGQQQRLCLARTLALSPDVILMDEPTSALDPIATSKVEELILKLKQKYTIILVTHSMTQAQRVSDETVFFYKGKIIEHGSTRKIFTNPSEKLTKDYISGKL